jgi:hypothetical protein
MAAFFAGVVRAPFTGLVLVGEMTASTELIVPMLVASSGAAADPSEVDSQRRCSSFRHHGGGMKTLACVAGLLGFVASGCVTAHPGEPIGKVNFGSMSTVGSQVSFDHGCPQDRIRVIKSEGPTVDLDVCGVVRRYKSVASGAPSGPGYTWLDVTSAYPASALPAPLPPVEGK